MKLIVSIAFLISSFLNNFDVSEDVAVALKSGKASELVKFFDERLTVKLVDQEDLLSKSQAEANVKYFFEKHPLKNFTVTHNSTLNSTVQFMTGTLETANGKYRISVLIRRNLISQLRIENDE
jgi:Domain of unknown function (DUF4783)